MDDERYKEAILNTCAEVPRLPLDVAPLPEHDLGTAHICPECSGIYALVTTVDECEAAECPDCGCLFTPKVESVTRRVIRRLSERREARVREALKMAEALSPVVPRGIDPDDYAAFRLALDGPDEEAAAENVYKPTV